MRYWWRKPQEHNVGRRTPTVYGGNHASCSAEHLVQIQLHSGIPACCQKGARRRVRVGGLSRLLPQHQLCFRHNGGGAVSGACGPGRRERVNEVSPLQASTGPARRTDGSFRAQLNNPQ